MTDHEHQAEDTAAQIVDVTITAPDAEWLRQHCAMLIERHLAASANIIPAIDSIYRWQGEIHHATEAYAILHTRMACVDRIADLTNEAHPYETVHVLAAKIDKSDIDYGQWVASSTLQSNEGQSGSV